jgi:hypothetical protein
MVLDMLAALRLGGLLRSVGGIALALTGSFSMNVLFAVLVRGLAAAYFTALSMPTALARSCPPLGQRPVSGATVSIARAAQVSGGRRVVGVPWLGAPGS